MRKNEVLNLPWANAYTISNVEDDNKNIWFSLLNYSMEQFSCYPGSWYFLKGEAFSIDFKATPISLLATWMESKT